MNYIYFNEYKDHPDARINPALLWEYDLSRFDFETMKQIVVQRVIERGWPEDWYAILNLYGEKDIKEVIKSLPYLNDKDMNFVSLVFRIPISKMKCYEKKRLRPIHWNS